MIPVEWCDEARTMLTAALDGASIQGFENDTQCKLYRTEGCYVVAQDEKPALRIWMVSGLNFVECANAINRYVKENGFTHVLFRTRWPGNLRLYGWLNPELVNPDMHEYRIWQF